MSDIVISARNISKHYRVFDTPRAQIVHALFPKYSKGMREIRALEDVSFDIHRGEAVAIIGRNGSGKSTLLQILTGTLEPTSGTFSVNGRVSALLELGSGFNPEYSGRDNVILNGLLLGFDREYILSKMPEIEAFAEIGAAIEQPTKTYSSGMVVRLAFAVQVMLEPEILIVDEALSVGDFFFQQKCLSYIRGLRDKGVTLLFVSHDMSTVRDLCEKGLVLQNGHVMFWGSNLEAVNRYLAVPRDQSATTASKELPPSGARRELDSPLWSGEKDEAGRLLAVGLYDENGLPTTAVRIGETLQMRVIYRDMQEPLHVTATLRNRYDQTITSFGTYTHGTQISAAVDASPVREINFKCRMMLEAGQYSLKMNIGHPTAPSRGTIVDETPWLGPFTIQWDYEERTPPFFGMAGLPTEITFLS